MVKLNDVKILNLLVLREAYRFIVLMVSAVVANIVFFPLTLLISRKKKQVVVIGRENGTFSDNTKHFYLCLQTEKKNEFSSSFLSSNQTTIEQLKKHSLPCLTYPSITGIYRLLTAEYIVMDSAEWVSGGKYQLSANGKLVQLWHGAPLKEIELPLHLRRLETLSLFPRLLLQWQKKIIGRYPDYYALLCTSNYFTQNAFSSAFKADHYLEYGYPRNDAIFKGKGDVVRQSPLWINCDHKTIDSIDDARSQKKKVILYAPTFRTDLSSPFSETVMPLKNLNDFAAAQDILMVMKLHPLMAKECVTENYFNIVHYAAECDIYPALSLFDCLITDYSSIYFDYLLLDRPVIFFPYDYEHYIEDERKLLFDYQEMTPGPVCRTMSELQTALLDFDSEHWVLRRNEVRQKVFDHFDDCASLRLYEFLKRQ